MVARSRMVTPDRGWAGTVAPWAADTPPLAAAARCRRRSSTAAVCWPTSGAGPLGSPGVSLKSTSGARVRTGPTRGSSMVPKANRLEMALDVWDPLIGVLEPGAVLGPHGNVADGGETSAAGSPGKPLRVQAPELHMHQSTVTDIVVVGRGQGLDEAGLDPLSTPAEVPHAEGANDPAHRSLAGVPAARVHRRVHGAIPVGLSLQVEHPAGLGRNDTLVPFDPAERALLPKARDGAVDQPRVQVRQGVIRQPPVSHVAGTEGLDQHISRAGELEGLLAACCRAEIHHNAFLPAVP